MSNILSKVLPGKFFIEGLSINPQISKIKLKNVSIIAPQGEKVIKVKSLTIKISPLTLIKSIINSKKLLIDSVTINNADINIIIKDNYINVAEAFFALDKNAKFRALIYKKMYKNNFMFFSDPNLISKKEVSKTPLTILVNNLNINNSKANLFLKTINIGSNDINIKNGSFQLLKNNILIRGDGELSDALIKINDKKIRIDKAKFYSYEQNFDYIELKKIFIYIKNSKFEADAKLGMNLLSRLNISLNGNLKSSIIKSIASENNIVIPKKVELGKKVTVEASLFGSTYYPMINLNLLLDHVKFDDIILKKGSLEAYYQAESSDLNLYLKEVLYRNKKIKRIRTNLSINNKDILNLENLSFDILDGGFKINSDFNFLTGKINLLNISLKNFSVDYIKDFIPLNIPSEYKHLIQGKLYSKINLRAEDIYKQKNINLNLYSRYKLIKEEIIGKQLTLKTKINYNNNNLKIYKGTYLKSNNLSLITDGKINLFRKNLNLNFDIKASRFEGILNQFNINDISGNMSLKGSIKGKFDNPLVKANINLNNFNYLQYKNNEISTDIKLEDGLLQLYGLSVVNQDFSSFITAKTKLYNKSLKKLLKEPEFSLFLNLENAKVGSIIQDKNIDLTLNSELTLYGTPSKLKGRFSSYSDNFTINNEPFSKLDLDIVFKEDDMTKDNILDIKKFIINKKDSKLLTLIGQLNLTNKNFNLEGFIPRLKMNDVVNLKMKNKSIVLGDLISSIKINGNIIDKIFNYDLKARFASFYYPYEIETTKTEIKKSEEFGKPNEITFKEVKIDKLLALGEGNLSIIGNQDSANINGELFDIISIKSTIGDLINHPILALDLNIKKFPLDKFYTLPIKSLITLDSHLKYDLLDKKILFGQIIFEDVNLKLGEMEITQAKREGEAKSKHCIVLIDDKKIKKNCVEYMNDKLYVDLGFSFLGEHINLSGSVDPFKEKIGLTMTGGINLKSFSYFKNIFSSVDGKAIIYSNIRGTFKKPKYNLNLQIRNASFQPTGYDKDITINNAKIQMKQNKVYIRNMKGNMLGGSFEITGDPQDNNLIFDLDKNNAFINLNANNLEYNLPEIADIETSLNLTLKGNIKNLKLYGTTKIIDGKFYQEINLVDNILNPITQKTEVYEEGVNLKTIPILKNISLDVNIINEGLVISNNLMTDVAVKANLTLLGTLGYPIIVGEITAKDGSVNLLRNIFDLTNLDIKFNKTDLLSSKLNFEAESIIKDYDPISDEYTNRNVLLKIIGNINNPKVELTGEGLTKVQTLMLLLTGQSGLNTSGTVVNEDKGGKITNQVFSILLQNSLSKLTSDFTKQTDISIQTSINSSGGLSVSANKRIADRVIVTGVGQFENNTLQKEISAEVIITDDLVIEILKAFEEGTTDLGLKYRLKLK